jgi:hypothetical protein
MDGRELGIKVTAFGQEGDCAPVVAEVHLASLAAALRGVHLDRQSSPRGFLFSVQ